MTTLPLIRLSSCELQTIADRISVLRDWYNGHPNVTPCLFNGDPTDLSTLTFISYELGEDLWDWDGGQTLSFAWGNVFVQRFGFQWVRLTEGNSPGEFAVQNSDLPSIVFPRPRLYELIAGRQYPHSAAEELFVMILSDLHSRDAVPHGWHPVVDALEGRSDDIPEEIVRMLQLLSKRDPNWFELLGLFPYEWKHGVAWDTVSTYLSIMINSADKHRRS